MLKITTSSPDREAAFQVVIRIALGAGEAAEVRAALEWSLVDRRTASGSPDTPQLDTYWDGRTDAAFRVGHSADILIQTGEALRESLWEVASESSKAKEISRALLIVEKALALSQNAISILASEHVMRSLEGD